MVTVDNREHRVVHVSMARATGHIEKVKFYCLPVRRHLGCHARPVARVAIMCQNQAIAVEIQHGDRIVVTGIVWRSRFLYLMYEGVSPGSNAERDPHGL